MNQESSSDKNSPNWSDRINRRDFAIWVICYFILYIFLSILLTDLTAKIFWTVLLDGSMLLFASKRFQDLDKNPSSAFLLLIGGFANFLPIGDSTFYAILFWVLASFNVLIILYLIFKEGTNGKNRYGQIPTNAKIL